MEQLNEFFRLLQTYWVQILSIGSVISGVAIYLRKTRFQDTVSQRKLKVDADDVFLKQIERLSVKLTKLYEDKNRLIDTIIYLKKNCPDCVPTLLNQLENAENNDKQA